MSVYKKMHDGPQDYSIVNGHLRHTNTFHASLSALQWAAERANQSYGIFVQDLSPADEKRIQEEYDSFKRDQTAPRVKDMQRVDTMTDPGFILTENDV